MLCIAQNGDAGMASKIHMRTQMLTHMLTGAWIRVNGRTVVLDVNDNPQAPW